MKIAWDIPKYLVNLDRHEGLDFKDLTTNFFAEATVYPVKRGRYMAIGEFGKRTIAVVFIPLGTEAISVISMRYASRTERKLR